MGSLPAQTPYNQNLGTTGEKQEQRINGAALIGNLTWNLFFPLQEVDCRNIHKWFLATAKFSSAVSFLCYFYFSPIYTHMSLGLTSRRSASWNLSLIVRKVFLWLVVIVFTAATTSAVGLFLLFFNPFQCVMFLSIDSNDFAVIVSFQMCESRALAHTSKTCWGHSSNPNPPALNHVPFAPSLIDQSFLLHTGGPNTSSPLSTNLK